MNMETNPEKAELNVKDIFSRVRTYFASLRCKLKGLFISLKPKLSDAKKGLTESIKEFHSVDAEGNEASKGKKAFYAGMSIGLAVLLLASLVFFGVVVSAPDSGMSVTVNADGRTAEYRTSEMSVFEFLNTVGVELKEGDEVFAEYRAISAFDSEQETDAPNTVKTMLSEDMDLQNGMHIEVKRAFPVAIAHMDTVDVINVTGGTVGNALEKAGVRYDVCDELSHRSFEDLTAGMRIEYADVNIRYDTSYKVLNYNEVTINDDSMYEGNTVLEQEGSDGEKQITQRVIVKNGIEVSREVVDQVVITPAIDEVMRVGTKIRYQTNYVGEWRRWRKAPTDDMIADVMYVECTAYTHTGNTTAMGTWPDLGTIAINPRFISYYSKLYVPGYGYGTALDTGAFRLYEDGNKNQIDLFFNTRKECIRWGRKRQFKIYILKSSVYVPRS